MVRPARPWLFDPGWLFVIAGLAMCAAWVLLPAQRDLARIEHQLANLEAEKTQLVERLRRHAELIAALDEGDDAVLRHLAAIDLGLVPEHHVPMIVARPTPISISRRLDRIVAPLDEPAPLPPPTRLEQLTSGPTRLWVLGASVLCVFAGLIVGPALRAPNRVAERATAADPKAEEDGAIATGAALEPERRRPRRRRRRRIAPAAASITDSAARIEEEDACDDPVRMHEDARADPTPMADLADVNSTPIDEAGALRDAMPRDGDDWPDAVDATGPTPAPEDSTTESSRPRVLSLAPPADEPIGTLFDGLAVAAPEPVTDASEHGAECDDPLDAGPDPLPDLLDESAEALALALGDRAESWSRDATVEAPGVTVPHAPSMAPAKTPGGVGHVVSRTAEAQTPALPTEAPDAGALGRVEVETKPGGAVETSDATEEVVGADAADGADEATEVDEEVDVAAEIEVEGDEEADDVEAEDASREDVEDVDAEAEDEYEEDDEEEDVEAEDEYEEDDDEEDAEAEDEYEEDDEEEDVEAGDEYEEDDEEEDVEAEDEYEEDDEEEDAEAEDEYEEDDEEDDVEAEDEYEEDDEEEDAEAEDEYEEDDEEEEYEYEDADADDGYVYVDEEGNEIPADQLGEYEFETAEEAPGEDAPRR